MTRLGWIVSSCQRLFLLHQAEDFGLLIHALSFILIIAISYTIR